MSLTRKQRQIVVSTPAARGELKNTRHYCSAIVNAVASRRGCAAQRRLFRSVTPVKSTRHFFGTSLTFAEQLPNWKLQTSTAQGD